MATIEEIQDHILHLKQGKEVAQRAHRKCMKEFNDWIKNLERRLKQKQQELNCSGPLGCENRKYDYTKDDCKKCVDGHNNYEYK